MKVIYIPSHDKIFAAIPLYQRFENDIATETFAPNQHSVVIRSFAYVDEPLAYVIDDGKVCHVISANYYNKMIKTKHAVEV